MSLLALQRDFRRWLTEEASGAAQQLGGEEVAAGLSVYLNNYRSQLMNALAEAFELTHTWMGDTAFHGAAATHIDRTPPSGWTLDDYACGFPDTLAELYPDDPEIAELARLELALAQCFVGPDCPPLAAESLAEVDWDRAILRLVPSLRMLPAGTNAAALWSALKAGTAPPAAALLDPPGSLALWRQEFTPSFRSLEAGEAEALERTAAGESFGALCVRLAERHGEAEGTAMAGAWLGQWLRDGLIAAVGENG